MYCPTCGKPLEEGKSFCKHCGARVAPNAATPPVPPPVDPGVGPPPAQQPNTPWTPPPAGWTPPPPPPPTFAAPPSQPTAWAVPPLPPSQPPSGSGSRTGLIVAIAIVAVLLLGGGVAAAVLLLAPTESESDRTQTSGVVVVTTTSPDAGSATTESPGTATTATIPGFDPDGTATTQPSSDTTVDTTGYQQAMDGLETVLLHCDERVPALAVQINNSAPSVPGSVSRELEDLYADVEEARSALGEYQPPPAYEEADQLIFEAADAMQNRIDQTSKGIDAMWNAGTVTAGTPYFDEGRRARDLFRTLFDQYRAARPAVT